MLPNIPSASYSVNIWCIGKGGMGGNAGNGWGLYKGGAGGAGANGGVLCVSSSIKYSDNIKLEYTNDDGTYGAKVSSNKFTLKAYNGGNGEMVRMQALLEVMEMEAQEEPVEPIKLKVL